jgi:geranylgeranyl pyrophosphate synthase
MSPDNLSTGHKIFMTQHPLLAELANENTEPHAVKAGNGSFANGTTAHGPSANGAANRNGHANGGAPSHGTPNGKENGRDAALELRAVNIMQSLEPLKPQLKEVEIEIERLVTSSIKSVTDVATHTLGAGGKRLRPALTILAAQACRPQLADAPLPTKVLSGAVAVELTHTTTLLHDDVVDSAEVRRGKPAANLIWGNGMSVLVGDFLFAQVFLMASQQGFTDLMAPLAQSTAQMCQGELLEAQGRGNLEMSEREYEEIVALKTASLTECSCRIGALAVEADEDQVARLADFGHRIGLAFQIVDDVFDITSSKGRIGKPVGNDIREGIVTLPMLRALQLTSGAEHEELRAILGRDMESVIAEEEVNRALEIIRGSGAPQAALQTALDHVAFAKAQLETFAPSPALTMLCDIADYVVARDK